MWLARSHEANCCDFSFWLLRYCHLKEKCFNHTVNALKFYYHTTQRWASRYWNHVKVKKFWDKTLRNKSCNFSEFEFVLTDVWYVMRIKILICNHWCFKIGFILKTWVFPPKSYRNIWIAFRVHWILEVIQKASQAIK